MRKFGYSDSSARALTATRTKTWAELLNKIDDEVLIDKMNEIAISEDKRASLQAIDMSWKLKDKYPAQKSKIIGLFEKITDLEAI